MPAAADVLATLHLIVQVGFVSVTLLLLIVTVMNRMRIRQVRLSWRTGKVLGFPLWPTLFLGAVVVFLVGALAFAHVLPLNVVAGYLLGGLLWFASSLLSSMVVVTEHGLICHPSRAGYVVAWEQVTDYFTTVVGRKTCYVFFYLDSSDTRRRLAVKPPRACYTAFAKTVAEKLDARFALSAHKVYGKKALEG